MKILCNIQIKLANQRGHIKFNVATMIVDMKKDI